ncbi:hypothetical protein AB0H03_11890 [Streptomyces sparsogenes]|uniref:hypothetical protein n=1 Tax=Streptomyces sparsogenes TaxID=67365 RepID=UPI0034083D40
MTLLVGVPVLWTGIVVCFNLISEGYRICDPEPYLGSVDKKQIYGHYRGQKGSELILKPSPAASETGEVTFTVKNWPVWEEPLISPDNPDRVSGSGVWDLEPMGEKTFHIRLSFDQPADMYGREKHELLSVGRDGSSFFLFDTPGGTDDCDFVLEKGK